MTETTNKDRCSGNYDTTHNSTSKRYRGRQSKSDSDDDTVTAPACHKRRLVPSNSCTSAATATSTATDATITLTRLVEWNRKGMSHYKEGQFLAAREAFQTALQLVHKDLRTPHFEQVRTDGSASLCSSSSSSQNDGRSRSCTINRYSCCCSHPHASRQKNCQEAPIASYIYQRLGFDEGMTVYNEVYPTLHDDHPQVMQATLLFNAGQATRHLKDWTSTRHFLELAISLFLPPQNSRPIQYSSTQLRQIQTVHTIIIPILHNLGYLSYRTASFRQAKLEYTTALVHARLLKGHYDISVGRTLNCLGVLHYHTTNNSKLRRQQQQQQQHHHPINKDRCIKYFQEASFILSHYVVFDFDDKKHDGPFVDFSEVATVWNNLGRVYFQKQDYAAAFILYRKAMEIRKHHLGCHHIDYGVAALNTGQSLLLQLSVLLDQEEQQEDSYDTSNHYDYYNDYYTQVLHLYGEFLRVAMTSLNSNHRDIAMALSDIAEIYQGRKEYKIAALLFYKSIEVGKSALGHHHADVAILLHRIASFHAEQKDFDKALEAYEDCLEIERLSMPFDIVESEDEDHDDNDDAVFSCHPCNVMITLNKIAEIYYQVRHYDNAIKYYTETLFLQRRYYGTSSPNVASTLSVIALIYEEQGLPAMAAKHLMEVLSIQRDLFQTDDHLHISTTLAHLGTLSLRLGETEISLRLLSNALRIRTKLLGIYNPEVSIVLYHIALCHQLHGSYHESIQCYKEALRIQDRINDTTTPSLDHDWNTMMILFRLGETYKANESLQDAIESYEKVLQVAKGKKEMQERVAMITTETLVGIGNIHLVNGSVAPMMEVFTKAARIRRQLGLCAFDLSVSRHLYALSIAYPEAAAAA